MIIPEHFKTNVIEPVLAYMGEMMNSRMNTESSVYLLLGTAVQESGLTYMRQLGDGPARGFYQIEPYTADSLHTHYLHYRPEYEKWIELLRNPLFDLETELTVNLYYATAIARLKYWDSPNIIPDKSDVLGMASIWKDVYNTENGKGKITDFVANYKTHVLEV